MYLWELFLTLKLYLSWTEWFELELFDKTEQLKIEMFLTIKLCTYN